MKKLFIMVLILNIGYTYAEPGNPRSFNEDRMLVQSSKNKKTKIKDFKNTETQKDSPTKKTDRIPSQFIPRNHR